MADTRKIVHCDCDSFYAAVEQRDRAELRGRPVAVGGVADGRGVVATASYEARRYGVRSAMPMAQARRLCPELICVRTDMERYREVSREVHGILRRFTEHIEPLSLDEAYLDVTDSQACRGSATRIAEAIRAAVRNELGITLSAGVAPNKFLAKVASDWHKPDGQLVVPPEEVDDFVRELPVARLPGVGPVTARRLADLGWERCEALQAVPLRTLVDRFGVFGERLHALCRGLDERPVRTHGERRSVSVERTYAEDLPDLPACRAELPPLLERLRARLERLDGEPPIARCMVKVRFDDFITTTAERPASRTDSDAYDALLATAWARGGRPVRLLGVGVGFKGASSSGRQLALLDA